jgi:hypothetical protein
MGGRRAQRDPVERGAVAVELAIVVPLLFALLFGIIDFGFTMSDSVSVRQGVREGARQGVVGSVGSLCTGSDTQKLVCLTKDRIGSVGGSVSVAVRLTSGDSVATAGHSLLVCAAVPMRSMTGLFSPILNGRYLTSKVDMRVEQTSSITPGGDNDPTGRNWSWCT